MRRNLSNTFDWSCSPWAMSFVLLAALLILVATGCLGDRQVERFYNGRNLTIHLTGVHRTDQVAYANQEDEVVRVVLPSDASLELVLVSMAIINYEVGQISLVIDEKAAVLVDEEGDKYTPFNPLIRAVPAQAPLSRWGIPSLWGIAELQQDMELRGFLYFEVPKGRGLSHVFWEETDSIRVDL